MYTSVHMTYILPITELRKNIFAIAEKVARTGEAVEIEKEGKRIVKIIPIADDPAARADYVLTHVLPKLARTWKVETSWLRGRREKRYWKRAIFS